MASDNPPRQPNKNSERRKQTDRISEISHRIGEIGANISSTVRGLGDHFSTLTHQIKADNKTTDTREKENYERSFWYVKWGTRSSIILSFFSLVTACGALYVVNKQLETMRIDQRAWITIEHKTTQSEENKPLIVELIIKNAGKTPAKKLESNFYVKTVKSDESPDLNLSGFAVGASAGILNPNNTIPHQIPMLKGTTDILNPPPLTHDETLKIANGKAYIVTFGKITYFDVYGISHWITYCSWQATGNIRSHYSAGKCTEYNNVDDN